MKFVNSRSGQLPDFYLIGAPKCGTTSLYSWLSSHPDLYMPVKEPGYFSRDIFPVPTNTLEKYRKLFSDAQRTSVLIGEASPRYLYSNEGLAEIARLNPAAKVIVILRNPVDLVISLHGQMLREGLEKEAFFSVAWESALARCNAKELLAESRCPKLLNYPLWGEVGTRMSYLSDTFRKSQIKLITLDELGHNAVGTYNHVLEFLGVPSDNKEHFPIANERAAIVNLRLHRTVISLRGKMFPFLKHLFRLSNGHGLGLLRLLNRFNLNAGAYQSPIDIGFRLKLVEYFAQEIDLLEELTRRDFTHWRC